MIRKYIPGGEFVNTGLDLLEGNSEVINSQLAVFLNKQHMLVWLVSQAQYRLVPAPLATLKVTTEWSLSVASHSTEIGDCAEASPQIRLSPRLTIFVQSISRRTMRASSSTNTVYATIPFVPTRNDEVECSPDCVLVG